MEVEFITELESTEVILSKNKAAKKKIKIKLNITLTSFV